MDRPPRHGAVEGAMSAIPRPSPEFVNLLRAQQVSESLEARVSDLAESDYWESARSASMGKQRRIAARNMRLLQRGGRRRCGWSSGTRSRR